jgi:hypothetical protein
MRCRKKKNPPLLDNNNKDHPILMVSFDIGTDHESIILNKILPAVKRDGHLHSII